MAINRMPMLEHRRHPHLLQRARELSRPTTAIISARRRRLAGYWVAAGYNSIGIVSSGGAGMALAHG
jgi:glycine/D-amino acid oxidase-like deaminating enzyme